MNRLLNKARTVLRIGPRETLRVLDERSRERREALAVSLGLNRWPHVAATPGTSPFFVVPQDRERLLAVLPTSERASLIARADAFCRHEFDFFGSGPVSLGEKIDWSRDFRSGFRWKRRYMRDLSLVDLGNDADVKVPWELSRHQHFVTLGQAYLLTGDEKYAREFVDELNDWMDENPPMLGVGWACTMDVALRAVSWTWAWHLFATSPTFTARDRQRFLSGIVAHGRFILGHLEWGDIRGNHYLSDGAGLAVIGLAFPWLAEAEEWRGKGFEIVWSELPLQLLPDGVDFEMSTSYQRLVLELFLTPTLLARLLGRQVPPEVWERIERGLEFTMAATRPDGEVALFGDADDGRCQILSEETRTRLNDHRYLLALGAALFARPDMKAASGGWHAELDWLLTPEDRAGFDALASDADLSSKAFPEGGFYVMRGGGSWVMADFGPVGLAGLGWHGHNDALSFEFAIGDVPVVIDSGTYVYTADIGARNELRGTRAHNVVVVDGREMADLGRDPWIIADQAKAEVVSWDPERQVLVGRHHGYERLGEPVTVRRTFRLDPESGALTLEDTLEGEGAHDVELRFHTALDLEVVDGAFVLTNDGKPVAHADSAGTGEPFIEEAWLSPSYGVRYRGSCVGWRWRHASLPWSARTCLVPSSEARR